MILKKITSILLCIIILFSVSVFPVFSLVAPVGTVSGESGRFYEDIKLPDGRATGVRYTQMNLSGTYGSGKVLRLAECDLSNTNLSIDVLNCSSALIKTATVASAAKAASVDGKTVLCALNGDLWMTAVNSNTNVTKKVLSTTRGIMMIDGEVWATQEFGMENYKNTSGASTTAAPKSAFGITDKNQPLVGIPVFSLYVKNETKSKTVQADGLNRLPAWDSVVVYNHRINSSNYALNDSYEVELTTDSAAFTIDGKVVATVKAIYPSGSTTRPSIGANSIIITARGNRMDEVAGAFSVGDRVSFDLELVDTYGRTELWHTVKDAIGGHMQVINDDGQIMVDTRSSEYPTSLIGVKDDGTVMFANVTASTSGVYKGLRYKDAYKLCSELGYNSVFYLDGGGSAAIVTLKDGTYTQRNHSSDGSVRSVINAVAMVWNDTPVCGEQGTLAYLSTQEELSALSPSFIPSGVLQRIDYLPNMVDTDYIVSENAFRMKVNASTNDPYVWFNMLCFKELIDTSRYNIVTVKLKTKTASRLNLGLYYITSSQAEIKSKTLSVSSSGNYTYATFSMGNESAWSGNLTHLRFDVYEGQSVGKGEFVDIEYIAFSTIPRDELELKNGVYPIGSVKNYYAYKDCSGTHTYNVFSKKDATQHKAECALCGYSILSSHTETNGTYVAPTCTKEGQRTTVCRDCDYVMSNVTLSKADHTYSEEYTVDIEPTVSSVGEKSRHCLYCTARTDVTEIPAVTIRFLKGDINGDGKVNAMDTNEVKRIIGGSLEFNESKRLAADVNTDGYVNAVDINILSRFIIGYITSLD